MMGVMWGMAGSGKIAMVSVLGRGVEVGREMAESGKMVVADAILMKQLLVAEGRGSLSLVCRTTNLLWILICLVLILAWISLSSWKVVLSKASACRFFMTRAQNLQLIWPWESWISISPKDTILVLSSASKAS